MKTATKWSIALTILTVILVTIIMIMSYQVEGVNKLMLWVLFLPVVGIRLYKSILMMSDATGESDYMKELNKRNKL